MHAEMKRLKAIKCKSKDHLLDHERQKKEQAQKVARLTRTELKAAVSDTVHNARLAQPGVDQHIEVDKIQAKTAIHLNVVNGTTKMTKVI